MKQFETLLYEAHDGIGTLRLNRPERLNAMQPHGARSRRGGDRCGHEHMLALTAAGRGFRPGTDLHHFSSGAADDSLTPLATLPWQK